MRRFILLLILGTGIGTFHLYAQFEKQISFGMSGNMMWQEGDFSDGLWQVKENQTRSIFSLGLYVDTYYFFGDFPIGLLGNILIHFASEMNNNGKTIDIFGVPFQMILGPAFYFDISERIRIVSGIGFHLSFLLIVAMESWTKEVASSYNIPEYAMWEFREGMGVGGKMSINFRFMGSLYFEMGSSFAYDFYSSYKNYQAIHVTPHIGLSIKSQ